MCVCVVCSCCCCRCCCLFFSYFYSFYLAWLAAITSILRKPNHSHLYWRKERKAITYLMRIDKFNIEWETFLCHSAQLRRLAGCSSVTNPSPFTPQIMPSWLLFPLKHQPESRSTTASSPSSPSFLTDWSCPLGSYIFDI